MESRSEEYISRQQRIAAAKEAFQENQPSKYYDRNPYVISNEQIDGTNVSEELPKKHTFRLLRMMAAGMLFLLLIFAFENGFSYHGFDQEYVQEMLNNETTWNRLQEQVKKIYFSLEDALGK